jgi:hypothetical protein
MPDLPSSAGRFRRILALCALIALMAGGAYAVASGGFTL